MIVLDAGALVGLERNDRARWAELRAAVIAGVDVVVPTAVVAQVWRGGSWQARLSQTLASCEIASFDEVAVRAGELCGRAGTADVVDASVALTAHDRNADAVLTSDPGDLSRLFESLGHRSTKIVRV